MDVNTFYGKKVCGTKTTCSANSLNDLIDELSAVDFHSANIYINPPAEDSDGDSDTSDNENSAEFSDKLSSKILRAPAEATLVTHREAEDDQEVDSDSDEDEPLITYVKNKSKKQKISQTVRDSWNRGDFVQTVTNQENGAEPTQQIHSEKPSELFELFFPEPFFEYIKEQTMLYARQKEANTSFEVSVEELKIFFAILLISGYSPKPRKDMYWSLDLDIRNEAIANAMSRNRFRVILKNLHFVNNAELPVNDKFAKIRPLIEHLNTVFMKYTPLSDNVRVSVDESMVPYYSHHSCKQRIQGKPIRYGFKFWSQNISNGYLVNTEPYQGKGTLLGASNLGLGASVVETFAERLKQNFPDQKFNFFIDNFFTGLPLLRKMSELEYGCTGTIRQNRLENCPLNKNAMKKSVRGSFDSYMNSSKDMVIMQWKDNSVVHVASNCYGVQPTKPARRYSAAEKKYITVDMPHAIQEYNSHMGGTDLMDRNISNYRPKLRNNKWWWQIFVHLLSASVSNAWLLYRISMDKKKKWASANNEIAENFRPLDLLEFTRSIVATYLLLNSRQQKLGRPSALFRRIPESVSKNMSVLHYPAAFKQNRCKICKKNTTFGCGICKINLHPVVCFKSFHENA